MDTLATVSQQKRFGWSSPGAPSSSPAPQTHFIFKSHLSLNTPGENKHLGHICMFGLGLKTALIPSAVDLSLCFIPHGKKAQGKKKKKSQREKRKTQPGSRGMGKFIQLSPWSRENAGKEDFQRHWEPGSRFSSKNQENPRENNSWVGRNH